MRVALLVVVALGALAPHARAQALVQLRTSHADPISALAVHAEREIVLSGDTAGNVIAWNLTTGAKGATLARHDARVLGIVPLTRTDRALIHLVDAEAVHQLVLWDWGGRRRVFTHSAVGAILSVAVSENGRFASYSVQADPSVRFLDLSDGDRRTLVRATEATVDWHAPSASGKRIVAYSRASGTITYYNLDGGSIQAQFASRAGLERLSLLPGRRYMAGYDPAVRRLVLVDLLSGAISDERSVVGFVGAYPGPWNDAELLVHRRPGETSSFELLEVTAGRFGPTAVRLSNPGAAAARAVASDHHTLFGADANGTMWRWDDPALDPEVFARDLVHPVHDLLALENRLDIVTGDRLIAIVTDRFTGSEIGRRRADDVTTRSLVLDTARDARFLSAGDATFALWTPGSRHAELWSYDPVALELTAWRADGVRGARSLAFSVDGVAALSRRGEALVLSADGVPQSGSGYRSVNAQAIVRAEAGVVIGSSDEGALGSSLVRLDPRTGETTPIANDASFVYALAYDPVHGNVYSIGIDADGRTPQTILQVHGGARLQRSRVVLRIPGEYLGAPIAVDPVDGSVYTGLDDRGAIRVWDGRRARRMAATVDPRRLAAHGDLIASIGRDGGVRLHDSTDGAVSARLYVLDEGAWIAIVPGYGFLASDHRVATHEFLSATGGALADYDLTR